MLKKIIAFLPLIILLSAVLALPALAGPATGDLLNYLDATAIKGGLTEQGGTKDVMPIIAGLINVVLSFTGVLFFAYIFYHGYHWATSNGNETIINEAKNGIKHAIIGVVIVFSAFIISNFTLSRIKQINAQPAAAPAAPPSTQTPSTN